MKSSLKIIAAIFTVLAAPMMSAPAYADEPPIYTSWRNNNAVGGYDAVSYFTGNPVKGDAKYFFQYKGATWFFSSQYNRNLFISEPTKYAPQYGGYCAWAVAMGKTAKGDPRHFSIVGDKLYLNFNGRIKKRWESAAEDFILAADANWPDVLDD